MAQLNNSTAAIPPQSLPFSERLSIGLLFSCVSLIGITLHILAISSAFKTKKASKSTFFILLLNVSISEVLIFIDYALYATPCVFTGTKIFGESFNVFAGVFQQLSFTASAYLALTIAINRALAIGKIQAVEANQKMRLQWTGVAICAWVAAIVVIGLNSVYFCYVAFDVSKGIFRGVCLESVKNQDRVPASVINYTITYGVTLVYAWCVFRIKQQKNLVHHSSSQKKISTYEKRLVYQAICIWIGMAVNPIAFKIIPVVLEGFAAAIVTSATVLLRFFITPVTTFVFWSETRTVAMNTFRCKKLEVHTQAGDTAH